MDNETVVAGRGSPALTPAMIDEWLGRAALIQDAQGRLDTADHPGSARSISGGAHPGARQDGPNSSGLAYVSTMLRAAVSGDVIAHRSARRSGANPASAAERTVETYLTSVAAGMLAASRLAAGDLDGRDLGGGSVDGGESAGAVPITVAAGLLAGAASLAGQAADANESRTDDANNLHNDNFRISAEARVAAAGAAAAADAAADGANLAVTVRAAARVAGSTVQIPTRIALLLTALADVVAPQTVVELLDDVELGTSVLGYDVGAFRLTFSIDCSRWATPRTLSTALRPRCLAFECTEESDVCDVDLLTGSPGRVMELIIGIGTPYHLEIAHLADLRG